MTIYKTEFMEKFAEKMGIDLKEKEGKDQAECAYKAFTETVVETLVAGDKIQLLGFGTFEVGERGAREGRNPQTGEAIRIEAAKVARFKAGKALKEALNP